MSDVASSRRSMTINQSTPEHAVRNSGQKRPEFLWKSDVEPENVVWKPTHLRIPPPKTVLP